MSTFLTPPVWYDKSGNLNEMLAGEIHDPNSIVIGSSAGTDPFVIDSVVIGGSATGDFAQITDNAIVIGKAASASASGAIAIGGGSSATAEGAIAIGDEASATSKNTIQLGKSSAQYTLQVGNGTGTSKIGALSFNNVTPTSITSSGLYWCTAEQTLSISGIQQIVCFNAFLWIGTANKTTASATDGAATFIYDKPEGQSGWAIRVSGNNVTNLKCYKVFA